MRYALETSVQRRLLLRMEMRTMAPNGMLMISHGHADWHALEVRGGLLQYQWDAGAGIGVLCLFYVIKCHFYRSCPHCRHGSQRWRLACSDCRATWTLRAPVTRWRLLC